MTHLQRLRTPSLDLDLRGLEVLQDAMMHRVQVRCRLLHALSTVVRLTGDTRAIAPATGVQGPIHALLLDLRRWPSVALCEPEGPPPPFETPTTSRAWLSGDRPGCTRAIPGP